MILDYTQLRTDGTLTKGTTTPRAAVETERFFDVAATVLFDINGETRSRLEAVWYIIWRTEHPEEPYRDEAAYFRFLDTVTGYPSAGQPLPPPDVGGTDDAGAG